MTDPNAIENNPFIELGEIPESKFTEGYDIQNFYIAVRDGTKIAVTLCLPKGLQEGEKIPTMLNQTRYWRAMELRIPFRWVLDEVTPQYPNPEIITARGYAFMITDTRGTGASFGNRKVPFHDDEVRDGYDIAEWIVSQPWSDGNIVAKGISYSGITSELFASNNHPAIKAVITGHGLWDPYLDVAFPGGVYDLAFMQMWSFLGKNLDINNPKVFREISPDIWLLGQGVFPVDEDTDRKMLGEASRIHEANQFVHKHTHDKDFRDTTLPDGITIKKVSVFNRKSEIERSNVPLLAWCSWYDSGYVDAVIHRFLNLENHSISILGDWNHGAHEPANAFHTERTSVTPTPRDKINAWMNFFDQCIAGEGPKKKVLYYYTLAEEKWKKTNIWPPKGHQYQRWYFLENNIIKTEKPVSNEGKDDYKVNFRATTGRLNRWWALLGLTITYEGREKSDQKLLCYTSPPFEQDTEITGQAIICLNMSSTHEDGAIFVYIEDVDENGKVTYITDGEFRVIHRKISSEEPPYKIMIPYHTYNEEDSAPLVPGEITEIKFGLHATSVLIRKGHRIRIAIGGADKDTFYRYPKEGRPTITISRNNLHASYIDLPIINREVQ